MKKRLYGIICLLVLVGFTACNESSVTEILNHETPGNNPISATIHIHSLAPYEGDLIIQNDKLTTMGETILGEGKLHYQGTEYVMLDLSVDNHPIIASGWKINLNMLTAKGKIPDEYIVLVPDNTKSPAMICTYDEASGRIDCYLREEILEGGVVSLDLEDFEFYYEGSVLQETEQMAKNLWYYHISDKEFQIPLLVLDGEWEYYSVMMIYKDCPALQYELNFAVCNHLVYIENLTSGKLISIPAFQISS